MGSASAVGRKLGGVVRYRSFGQSGIRISEVILGAMMFGDGTDWIGRRTADAAEAGRIFDAYREAGGNVVDTANIYTDGLSEKVVGDLVSSCRDEVLLSSKYSITTNRSDPNASGNHRKNLRQSIEASLERLGTDYIDIFWAHFWDPLTPVEETVRALDDLVSSGLVLATGISDTPAWVIARANTWAKAAGRTPYAGIQVPYSAVQRDVERELLPMAEAMDLSVTAWSPLEGGALAGRFSDPDAASELDERTGSAAVAVGSVAAELGVSSAQVALRWLLDQPSHPHPIIGSSKATQVVDALGCMGIELSDDQRQKITDAAPVDLGFPGDLYNDLAGFVYGDVLPDIEGL